MKNPFMTALTVIAITATGCGGQTTNDGAPTNQPNGNCSDTSPNGCPDAQTEVECSGLDHSNCVANKDQCRTLEGQRVIAPGQCVEAKEFAACLAIDHPCGGSDLYVRNPSSGEIWWLNGCVPPGWTSEGLSDWDRCGPPDIDPNVECSALDENSCLAHQDRCRTIVGQREIAPAVCSKEMEFAVCAEKNQECILAYFPARNPTSGELWWFDGCYPVGWLPVSDVEVCSDLYIPGQECYEFDESACLENSEMCSPLKGLRVSETGQCAEEMEFAACKIAGSFCSQTFKWARDPASGQLWLFNGCSPYGWPVENPGYSTAGCHFW